MALTVRARCATEAYRTGGVLFCIIRHLLNGVAVPSTSSFISLVSQIAASHPMTSHHPNPTHQQSHPPIHKPTSPPKNQATLQSKVPVLKHPSRQESLVTVAPVAAASLASLHNSLNHRPAAPARSLTSPLPDWPLQAKPLDTRPSQVAVLLLSFRVSSKRDKTAIFKNFHFRYLTEGSGTCYRAAFEIVIRDVHYLH